MLEAIIQPKWWSSQQHRDRIFTDVLYDWESLIGQYSRQSGEAVSDSIKCATILGYGPRDIVTHLRGAQSLVRRSFPEMRNSIREFLSGQEGVSSYVP